MPSVKDLIDLANYFGLTPHNLFPLFILGAFFYLYISKSFDPVKNRVKNIETCITEIQASLRAKHKMTFVHAVDKYGVAKSPMVLKDDWKPFITSVGIDVQIKNKENELLNWLKEQKPKTGIDAQDKILDLIGSGGIEKYLDLTKYKQNLYQKGKTSDDVVGVLWVYLSEVLIPKLKFDIKK